MTKRLHLQILVVSKSGDKKDLVTVVYDETGDREADKSMIVKRFAEELSLLGHDVAADTLKAISVTADRGLMTQEELEKNITLCDICGDIAIAMNSKSGENFCLAHLDPEVRANVFKHMEDVFKDTIESREQKPDRQKLH